MPRTSPQSAFGAFPFLRLGNRGTSGQGDCGPRVDSKSEVTDKFGHLEHLAVEAISEFLESDGGDPSLREKARVAQASLGTISRFRATESARDAMAFHMARTLTSDPGELAEYIRITQPNAAIVKALPEKAV